MFTICILFTTLLLYTTKTYGVREGASKQTYMSTAPPGFEIPGSATAYQIRSYDIPLCVLK